MKVRIVTFAALRDRLGWSDREIELEAGATVGAAAKTAFGAEPPRGIAYAVNQTYTGVDTVLIEGDELALLPPVAGGAPRLSVQSTPIDVAELIAETTAANCGAVLVFLGTAREVEDELLELLEYEAYTPMAEKFFADVADEIRAVHAVEAVTIVHRVGSLKVGEVSVAIVVASPHRGPGFDALRQAIERIKEAAPVWKKEVTRKRATWIRAEEID